jgi:pantetheine-phosphate adenylyltransferase
MKKIAVFPGSFDPFTIGHEAIVQRAFTLFDEIIIAIGANALKKSYYSLDTRKEMISMVFKDDPRIKVSYFEGLTVDYCKSIGAEYLIRGLRTSADFEFERAIAQTNRVLNSNIESVFLLTVPEHSHVNSTIVRDIIKSGGDASAFVPKSIDLNKFRGEE